MKSKAELEKWYSKEDPWGYVNTVPDKIRRAILQQQLEVVFSDGAMKTALDAGCGEGYITKDVASRYNVQVDAFDISENALATARRKNACESIHYFQLDLNDYVPDKQYDLIMCEETLYYLSDENRSLTVRKFHEGLNAGGYLKVTSITVGETRFRKYFTLDSLQKLLVNNGFELVSVLPSVILKNNLQRKVLFKVSEYANKSNLINPAMLAYLIKVTLNSPLKDCYAISLLAKKI